MKYPQRGQSNLQPRSNIGESQFGQMRCILSCFGSPEQLSSESGVGIDSLT